MTDPKLPLYLPDPFARAAWHMKHMHPLTLTQTMPLSSAVAGDQVTVGFPAKILAATDSAGNLWMERPDGTFTSVLTRAITSADSITFTVEGDRFAKFWHELADFIAGQGEQLAAAGGRWGMCDEPGACHKAEDIAQRYLAALTEAELAQIPPDVHS